MPKKVCRRASSEHVDSDWRELDRQIGCEGRNCSGQCGGSWETHTGAASARAAHEQQFSSRSDLVSGMTGQGHLEQQQQVRVDLAPHFVEVHLDQASVIGPPAVVLSECRRAMWSRPWRGVTPVDGSSLMNT
jgi:hypothetical protein